MLRLPVESARPCLLTGRLQGSSECLARPAVFARCPSVIPRTQPAVAVAAAQQISQPADIAQPATSSHQQEENAPVQQQQQKSAFEIKRLERQKQKKREQATYRAAAVLATVGLTSLAIVATWLRFYWHIQTEGDFPWGEMAGTLLLVAGGVVGMEMYARFAHKVLWHDFQPGWALHKSHHEPRTGPFEANDIYAVANAVPAIALCAYGFVTPHMVGGACFGAGLGITLYGIMYMFFHDGVVHKRFPVGPIANLDYIKQVTVAHQIHHSGKFGGVPWGMFLGPQELDAVPGGREELERLVQEMFPGTTKKSAA